jgi:hypothetical protein
MASNVDEYRARAAEYDRKAATLSHGNARIRTYYQSLAKHWRSLALLTEAKAEREPRQTSPSCRSDLRHET